MRRVALLASRGQIGMLRSRSSRPPLFIYSWAPCSAGEGREFSRDIYQHEITLSRGLRDLGKLKFPYSVDYSHQYVYLLMGSDSCFSDPASYAKSRRFDFSVWVRDSTLVQIH